MSDEELDDAKWKAQMAAGASAFGGPALTSTQMEELQKRVNADETIEKKYPGISIHTCHLILPLY